MAPFRSRRKRHFHAARPLIAFLLVASFGILFAGCSNNPAEEEFTFTQDDLAEFRDIADDPLASSGTGDTAEVPYLVPLPSGSGSEVSSVLLDLSRIPSYTAIRTGGETERNVYRVTNEFVTVRSEPSSTSAAIGRFDRGQSVKVLSFPDASWAEIEMPEGKKGYVAVRYLARVTSDEKLAEEKKMFDGQYYVNYTFVNVRSAPDQSSEKIGEIPGQRIVRPSSIQNGWAAVTFDGKTGYVSAGYLAPFLPSFQVRQERFELPILLYRLSGDSTVLLTNLAEHVRLLKEQGYTFMTLRSFSDLLTQQESRDVRLNPKSVVVAIGGVTNTNVQVISDTLNAAGIDGTLFIQTSQLGISGLTEKTLQTLRANGFDLATGGHVGDDLRALTNAQATLELQQSRKLLEERSGAPVLAIGYPQSGVNDRIAELAAEAGYLLGVGGGSSRTFTRADLLKLPSIEIFPTMAAGDVVKLATGQ